MSGFDAVPAWKTWWRIFVIWFLATCRNPANWLYPFLLMLLGSLILVVSQPAGTTLIQQSSNLGAQWALATLVVYWQTFQAFHHDHRNGITQQHQLSHLPLSWFCGIRLVVQWLSLCLPLALVWLITGPVLGYDMDRAVRAALAWLIGSPALLVWGSVSACVVIVLRRPAMLSMLLALPWSLPAVIFANGALYHGTLDSWLLLLAFSAFSLALGPWILAGCWRWSVRV